MLECVQLARVVKRWSMHKRERATMTAASRSEEQRRTDSDTSSHTEILCTSHESMQPRVWASLDIAGASRRRFVPSGRSGQMLTCGRVGSDRGHTRHVPSEDAH